MIIFSAIFLTISAIYVVSPQSRIISIQGLSLIIPVIAALIGLYTSRLYGFKSANGRTILLITGGIVCWALAEITFFVLDFFMNSENLFPSIADVLFLLAYLFFLPGIYQGFVTAEVKLRNVKKSLLAIVVSASVILTILVGYFVVYQAFDPSADVLANIVNISYGVGDLILIIASMLTILVASEYGDGKLASFWKAMASGFFMGLVADILFAIYSDKMLGDVKPYTYIDLIWTAGYLFYAFAMLENYLHISAVQQNIRLRLLQRK